jgi:hypothetical protein
VHELCIIVQMVVPVYVQQWHADTPGPSARVHCCLGPAAGDLHLFLAARISLRAGSCAPVSIAESVTQVCCLQIS